MIKRQLLILCIFCLQALSMRAHGQLGFRPENYYQVYAFQDLGAVDTTNFNSDMARGGNGLSGLSGNGSHFFRNGAMNDKGECVVGGRVWLPQAAYGLVKGWNEIPPAPSSGRSRNYALSLDNDGRILTVDGVFVNGAFLPTPSEAASFFSYQLSMDGALLGQLPGTDPDRILPPSASRFGWEPGRRDFLPIDVRRLTLPAANAQPGLPVNRGLAIGARAGITGGIVYGSDLMDYYTIWDASGHHVLDTLAVPNGARDVSSPKNDPFALGHIVSINSRGETLFGPRAYAGDRLRSYYLFLPKDAYNLSAGVHQLSGLFSTQFRTMAGINDRGEILGRGEVAGAFPTNQIFVGNLNDRAATRFPQLSGDPFAPFSGAGTWEKSNPVALNNSGELLCLRDYEENSQLKSFIQSPGVGFLMDYRYVAIGSEIGLECQITMTNIGRSTLTGISDPIQALVPTSNPQPTRVSPPNASLTLNPGETVVRTAQFKGIVNGGRYSFRAGVTNSAPQGTREKWLQGVQQRLAITASYPPLEITYTVNPKEVAVDQDIEVKMMVRNLTGKDLTNVRVNPVEVISPDLATLKSGPVPTSTAMLANGETTTFTSIYKASSFGKVTFATTATGTASTGPIQSSRVVSPEVTIRLNADLLIQRAQTDEYFGDNIYQKVAAGVQIAKYPLATSELRDIRFRLQNDDSKPRTLRLNVSALANELPKWELTYLRNGEDITSQLAGGLTISLPELTAGASHTITARIKPKPALRQGEVIKLRFSSGSALVPTETLDQVEAQVIHAGEIIVNSTADLPEDADEADGICDTGRFLPRTTTPEVTLRAAIDWANRHEEPDIIQFEIPSEDAHYRGGKPLIEPRTALPDITDTVKIDGFSQNPSSHTPSIELSGQNIPRPERSETPNTYLLHWPGAASGLVLAATECEIRGLVINRFAMAGIYCAGNYSIIEGNYVGLEADGVHSAPNGQGGFFSPDEGYRFLRGAGIAITSSGNLIGGTTSTSRNVIAGTGSLTFTYPHYPPCILITGQEAFRNQILGNYIGLQADGLKYNDYGDGDEQNPVSIINSIAGIQIQGLASENKIGDGTPAGRNYIAGGLEIGIVIDRAADNLVFGNSIGSDILGASKLKDTIGVVIDNGGGNRIGGPEVGQRNALVGGTGISIEGSESRSNTIENNWLGKSHSGKALGCYRGIACTSLTPVTSAIISENLIVNAFQSGITIELPFRGTISNNEIESASIHGIFLMDKPFETQLGPPLVLERNFVHDCGLKAPASVKAAGCFSQATRGNVTLKENRFYNNRNFGIQLDHPVDISGIETQHDQYAHQATALLENDESDSDTGPNGLLNHPIISRLAGACTLSSGTLTASFAYSGAPFMRLHVEFFVSATASMSGYGEGQLFIGAIEIETDSSGYATAIFTQPSEATTGSYLSCTATDPAGNTSEFSNSVMIQGPNGNRNGLSNELENKAPTRNQPSPFARNNTSSGSGNLPRGLTLGDGNGDNVLDSAQANVASFPTLLGKWITLVVPPTQALESVGPIGLGDLPAAPASYAFPYGAIRFTVADLGAGANTNITAFLHEILPLMTVFAYGPSSNNPMPHWYEFSPENGLGATLGTGQFTISAKDNGRADSNANPAHLTLTLAPALLVPSPPQLTVVEAKSTFYNTPVYQTIAGNVVLTNELLQSTEVTLRWPETDNLFLQSTSNLSFPWQPEPINAVLQNDHYEMKTTSESTNKFYRLLRPVPRF